MRDHHKTIDRHGKKYLIAWDNYSRFSDLIEIFDITNTDDVLFIGKLITNNIEKGIDFLIGAEE